jgi:ubiquinone biosynthesis protein
MRILRFYTIQKTLLEHGLEELIPAKWWPWYMQLGRVSAFWLRNRYPDKLRGERLRLALQSLGPVFVKLGQMLSTRRDLLPQDIADELTLLQDQVQPFDGVEAQHLIEQALGIQSIDQLFSDFDVKPLASASIAQVHSAKLIESDKQVIIKVIRPNIKQTIEADIQLMEALAEALQKLLPDGRRLRPVEVVEEYRRTILDELDLLREAGNGIQLRSNFDDSPSLYVPEIYSDYCRSNVMVMERIWGIPVADVERLEKVGVDMKKLAERGVEVFFTQVFRDSFFHADMHPGNIFVSNETPHDPQYIAIDFGIVGTLNREDKRYLAENFIAFFNRDYRKVAELHVDSGWVPSDTQVDDFEMAIRAVCEPIFQKPLDEISFSNVLLQLFNTARRFNMQVQPQLVLLQKTLLYIEGLGRQLYPQLDLWSTAKPFLENWMKEQIGLSAMANKVKSNLPFWSEKLPEIPDLVYDTLKQTKRLPEQQRNIAAQQMQQQKYLIKMIFYGLFAASSGIVAMLSHGLAYHGAFSGIALGLSAFGWIKAWRYSHKQ